MGLDAVVFCDCVETKRLEVPHPFPNLLCVESNGSPEITSENPMKLISTMTGWLSRLASTMR